MLMSCKRGAARVQAHHTAHLPAKFLSVGGGLSVILDKPPPDDEAITTVSSAQVNLSLAHPARRPIACQPCCAWLHGLMN